MSASDWPQAIKDLPPLRDVIAAHDLAAKKSLGQNFLLDLNLTNKIAQAAGDLTDVTVIEVGPGPGGLTRALVASRAKQVVAVERDRRCVVALLDLVKASNGRLNVVEGDAQTTDVLALAPAPRAVVANLPYNIGTELLIDWLHQAQNYVSFTLMFQKEVAERIVATPEQREAYGRLAVLVQAAATAKIVMTLPPSAFTPPPKVHSSVVHIVPRDKPLAPLKVLGQVTAAAFGQRRKMVRSSLGSLFSEAELEAHGIKPTDRAENITVAQYVALANTLASSPLGRGGEPQARR